MKVYIYPQHKKDQTANPYVNNQEWSLGKYFDIIHPEYHCRLPQPMRLLLGSFKADNYVLNWIEDAAEGSRSKLLRGIMTLLALRVIWIRKAKIVWVLHNIHPHNGETKWSYRIKKFLFQKSTLIVSHSKEATDYARQLASCPVYFKNHPVKFTGYGEWPGEVYDCDFYIWGNIIPYKGVLEFVSNPLCNSMGRKILIVGKCGDEKLAKEIERHCRNNIVFENRRAGFDEVSAQCKKAKYVLFPYVGDSISSSGVLMDTLQMGGTPVGPNRGAFADLAKEKCCVVYDNIDEIFSLPVKEDKVCISQKEKTKFLNENSWDSFGKWLLEVVNKKN